MASKNDDTGVTGQSQAAKKYIPPHLRKMMAEQAMNPSPVVSKPESAPASTQRGTSGRFADIDRRQPVERAPRVSARQPIGEDETAWTRRDDRRPWFDDERELFKEHMTTGIKFDDYDKIPVEISGRGSSDFAPIDRFRDAKLHHMLIDNIDRCKYTRPTPVQKHSIPIIQAGRDLMACAQTGSGKTAAFLLPTIDLMLREGPPTIGAATGRGGSSFLNASRKSYPVTLVLAPTRELASQIFEESRKFCFKTGIRPVVVYGGADVRLQFRELERGCDILVATPGRLMDLIDRARCSVEYVRHLIFDEADRMLDMGFEPQIRKIVEDSGMPETDRTSTMFSATFAREVQHLARDFLYDYVFLTVGRVGATAGSITQNLRYVEEFNKYREVRRILEEQVEEGLTLIFVETKRKADEIENSLREEGYPATSIHGDRAQWEREEALRLFKSGRLPILVATDVAARGLDIPNVNHVINYDLPTNIDDYVHRIGRTGRAGNQGTATSFVNESNRGILNELWATLEETKQEIPTWFQSMCSSAGRFGGSGGGGFRSRGKGGKGGRPSNMASRDIRQGSSVTTFHHRSGNEGAGAPAPSGGQNWRSKDSKPQESAPSSVAAPRRTAQPTRTQQPSASDDAW